MEQIRFNYYIVRSKKYGLTFMAIAPINQYSNFNNNFRSQTRSNFLLENGMLFLRKDLNSKDFWIEIKNFLQDPSEWNALNLNEGVIFLKEELEEYIRLSLEMEISDLKINREKLTLTVLREMRLSQLNTFHIAAFIDSIPLLEKALEQRKDLNIQISIPTKLFSRGMSPIAIAFYHHNLKAFEWLLKKDKNSLSQIAKFSEALRYSFEHQKEFAPLLIKHGYLEYEVATDFFGRSSFLEAITSQDEDFVLFLLDSGADVNLSDDINHNNGLSIAIKNANVNFTKILLSRGANPLFEFKNNQTPLKIAIEDGNFEIISLLLNYVDRSKLSVEKLEIINSTHLNEDIVFLLAKYGFKTNCESVLELLEENNNELIVTMITTGFIDINSKDSVGTPLFHHAICDKKYFLVRYMYDAGVDLNIPDSNGVLPIHLAVCIRDLVILDLLLKKVDPSSKTATLITPLHIAVARGFQDIVECLVGAGADINAVDYLAQMPLDLAYISPQQASLAQYLLKNGAYSQIFSYSTYNRMKQGKVENVNSSKTNKKTQSEWQEKTKKKLLAHAFNLGGYSPQANRAGQQIQPPLALEGLTHDAWLMNKAHKNIFNVSSRYPEYVPYRTVSEIIDACKFSARPFSKTSDQYLERIQKNQSTIISSGYWFHGVEWVISKDLIILVNTGAYSEEWAIKVYRYNEKKLTKHVIEEMRSLSLGSGDNYYAAVQKFRKILDCSRGHFEETFEKCCSILKQTVGNCIYKSFSGAIWTLFALQETIEDRDKSISLHSINEKVMKAEKRFDISSRFSELLYVENYLNFHLSDESLYYPDMDLVNKVMNILSASIQKKHPLFLEFERVNMKYKKLQKRFRPLNCDDIKSRASDFARDALEASGGKQPTYLTLYREYFFINEEFEDEQKNIEEIST